MPETYAACKTQYERIYLYWANRKNRGYDAHNAQVARQEVSAHVGSETGVEEIWETLYFLTTGSSASYYPGLVDRYIKEADDVYSLMRLYIFLRFHSPCEEFLPRVLDKLFSLKMSTDDRRYALEIVSSHKISGYDYRRHVRSSILFSLGMQ